MSEHCPHYTKVAYKKDGQTTLWVTDENGKRIKKTVTIGEKFDAVVVRLRCKQWSCEYCADKNRAQWRAFLHERLATFKSDFRLMTLTPVDASISQYAAYKALQKGIDTLLKRMRRLFGQISYVRTFEAFPTNNAIHAHFIIAGLSPYVAYGTNTKHVLTYLAMESRRWRQGVWSLQTWLKHNAEQCGLGYMADARDIPRGKAVNYVTKYLTKVGQDIKIKGLRRVQTTQDIGGLKEFQANGWTTADFITARDFSAGAKILDLNTGEVIGNDYWEQNRLYPLD